MPVRSATEMARMPDGQRPPAARAFFYQRWSARAVTIEPEPRAAFTSEFCSDYKDCASANVDYDV